MLNCVFQCDYYYIIIIIRCTVLCEDLGAVYFWPWGTVAQSVKLWLYWDEAKLTSFGSETSDKL